MKNYTIQKSQTPKWFESNLLEYISHLRIEQKEGKKYVWGQVRRRWLIVSPEELVRQCFIHYAHVKLGYSLKRFSVERMVKVGEITKRYDLTYYSTSGKLLVLAEFKRPEYQLNMKSIEQISIYHKTLDAPYVLLSNGIQHLLLENSTKTQDYAYLNGFPIEKWYY